MLLYCRDDEDEIEETKIGDKLVEEPTGGVMAETSLQRLPSDLVMKQSNDEAKTDAGEADAEETDVEEEEMPEMPEVGAYLCPLFMCGS